MDLISQINGVCLAQVVVCMVLVDGARVASPPHVNVKVGLVKALAHELVVVCMVLVDGARVASPPRVNVKVGLVKALAHELRRARAHTNIGTSLQ